MKPMLAAPFSRSKAQFPAIAEPKIDGVRARIDKGVAYTRSGLPFTNEKIQAWAKQNAARLNGLDGELVVGAANARGSFSATQSGALARGTSPAFTFHAFDHTGMPDRPYSERRAAAARAVEGVPNARAVPAHRVNSLAELERLEGKIVKAGYEGVIVRKPEAPYKAGRTTTADGSMLKLKRFSDGEARVLGVKELMRKGGTPGGTAGALEVEINGQRFKLGVPADQRGAIWARRDTIAGETVQFRHKGGGRVPRDAVLEGFRSALDMDKPKSKSGKARAPNSLAATLEADAAQQIKARLANMTPAPARGSAMIEGMSSIGRATASATAGMVESQARASSSKMVSGMSDAAKRPAMSPRQVAALKGWETRRGGGNPSQQTVTRATSKIARAGMSAGPKMAIGLAVGGMAFAAMSKAAEAGESRGEQIKAGATEGAKSFARTAGMQAAIIAADQSLARAVPTLAVGGARALVTAAKWALPAVGLAMTAYGAVKGYQQGGVKGALVGSLTGGYVPAGMRTAAPASSPQPIEKIGSAPGLIGFQNRDNLIAALKAQGKSPPGMGEVSGASKPTGGAYINERAARADAGGRTTGGDRGGGGPRPAAAKPRGGTGHVDPYMRNGIQVGGYDRATRV